MLTFLIGLVIGVIVGAFGAGWVIINYARQLQQEDEEMRAIRKRTKEAGHVPSDLDVGPFLGDEAAAAEHKKLQDEKIKESMQQGRLKHFQYIINDKGLTKNEDANAVLYYIAINDPETFLSNRSIANILGWGTPRVSRAIAYLRRNDYIRDNETKGNQGTQYRLLSKAQPKKAKKA